MTTLRRPLTLALATAVLVALPAASAPPAGPPAQLWIDVSTHSVSGMPDLEALGGLGRLATRMGGGGEPATHYPAARGVGTSPGKVIDVAFHSRLAPGMEVSQQVPQGLGAGATLGLVPPLTAPPTPDGPDGPEPETDYTIHEYWGCGASVRPGQPKTARVRVKGGQMEMTGALSGQLAAPKRGIDSVPPYALWPNRKNRRPLPLPANASLVGQHRITGQGVPESMQFQLDRSADFLPKIALSSTGVPADAIELSWQPVDRARAYLVTAMGMKGEREIVVWSSSETAGAGTALVDYLDSSHLDRWLRDKVLLAPATGRCTVPKGIFAATSPGPAAGAGASAGEGFGALTMIAYGPESNLTWPPKPADPKAPWNPEWNVRVRTKSTTTAMLGMDLGDMEGMDGMDTPARDGQDAPGERKPEEGGAKKLLRGLLRNL